jgi:hypothetical protein
LLASLRIHLSFSFVYHHHKKIWANGV